MITKSDLVIKISIFTITLIAILFGRLTSKYLNAQTLTSSPSPTLKVTTNPSEDKEIQELKDKIATKVAELRQKNSRAIGGVVQEPLSSKKIIIIKTDKDDIYQIKVDPDLTKFYRISGNQKKEVTSASVKKDTYIFTTGIVKEKFIEANIVYVDEKFILGMGRITEVNKDDYFIRAITLDKANFTLDIETFTRQQMLNIKTLKFENVGFSKIKEGDTIQFVVKKTGNERELNRFSAQKILIIPQEYFVK